MSGTVKESLSRSHHLPIFQISNYVINDGQASNSNDAYNIMICVILTLNSLYTF